ncbi:MAG: HU family DNA-binding protein [Bacteroidales bacterium]
MKYKVVEKVNPLDPEGGKLYTAELVEEKVIHEDEFYQAVSERSDVKVEAVKEIFETIMLAAMKKLQVHDVVDVEGFGTFTRVREKVKLPAKAGKKRKIHIVEYIEFEPLGGFHPTFERVDEE